VEPKSLVHSTIDSRIGYLKCVYFPGAFGIEFGRELDRVVSDLNRRGCDRLILDLRGNIGGSLGFAGLASYLFAGRMPIGHSLTPARLRSGYDPKTLPQVRMPDSVSDLAFTLARYAFRDKSIVLLTQGLGQQPFHGRIVVLVNQWTNSAGEMVACFALENELASVIGQKTAGNVLGATNFRVGGGYWLRLPVFGWYTSRGDSIEGKGVAPKTVIDLSPEELSQGIDNQIQRALEIIRDL
jgi:C-terminal processing protease CtpA/Prc